MFIKDLSVAYLLDFYGDVLSEKTRDLLRQYYDDDLSLGEIAEGTGISRQAVWQALKKGEDELRFLEEKLGLAADYREMRSVAEKLLSLSAACDTAEDTTVCELAKTAAQCAALILQKEQEGD